MVLAELPDAPEGDPDTDAHGHRNFFFPTTGRLPHPPPALAGAVVTDVSKHFGVHCVSVVLFLGTL